MLKRLVNGEYSLKIAFWLFGVLGLFIFNIITHVTHSSILHQICPRGIMCSRSVILFTLSNLVGVFFNKGHLMTLIGMHILFGAMFLIYAYLLLRGIWKSSAAYEGKKFWPFCAKLILVCWVLISLKSIL